MKIGRMQRGVDDAEGMKADLRFGIWRARIFCGNSPLPFITGRRDQTFRFYGTEVFLLAVIVDGVSFIP